MNPTDYLRLGVEQYLRELPDEEFAELVLRVRPPGDKPTCNDSASFARNLFQGGND